MINRWILSTVLIFYSTTTDMLAVEIKLKDSKKEEKSPNVIEEKEEPLKVESEMLDIKKKDHEYFSGSPLFKLSPIRVPIIQNGVWVADLFCRLDCEVQNEADYTNNAPHIFYTLVDSVFTTLYNTLGERFIVKSPLEVEVWRPLLKAAIEYYIPIKNLYFRQFCLVEYKHKPPTSKLSTH